MLGWLTKASQSFRGLLAKLFLRRRPKDEPPPVFIEAPPQPQPAEPQPAEPKAEQFKPNRKLRRAIKSTEAKQLERARLKFDKFVEPKGEKPKKREHSEVEEGPAPEPTKPASVGLSFEDVDNQDFYIVDEHHSDRKTEVLYYDKEIYGEFNFRDTLLDQLDRYFVYLERMQKQDPEAYGFYREVGVQLLPYAAIPDLWSENIGREHDKDEYKAWAKPSAWFLKTRPTFGCIAYGANPEGEKIESGAYRKKPSDKKLLLPKFYYFIKYGQGGAPVEVQPKHSGDVYKLAVCWDDPSNKDWKHGAVQEFPFFVGDDGRIEVLRMFKTQMLPIYSKKYGLNHIPSTCWRFPNHADDWAKTHHTTARKLLNNLFCGLTGDIETAAYSMARVTVTDSKGRHAVFSLDPRRMAYFFQDRDYQLTETGSRRPVFHLVRPHEREDGTVRKMHFRGAREFEWAGYKVRITVPGLDHRMLEEMNLPVHDEYRLAKKKKSRAVAEPEVGRIIRAEMDGHPLKKGDIKTIIIPSKQDIKRQMMQEARKQ